jgi:protease-4
MSDIPPPPDDPRAERWGQGPDALERERREGKPVSFYLAIFLALLLFVSGGLNLLLLVVSAFGSATAGLATVGEDDSAWEIVAVGGDPDADKRILRVPIQGAIAESTSPVIGAVGGTVSQVKRALKVAARDDSIAGVILDINSPGGGVTDSDLIWREIRDFQSEHEKPIVALFGDVAASGGYYIAAPCDKIFARPTTITGSIGVIVSNINVAEAADKLGIHQEVVVSENTPHKDMLSPFRPMTDEEREILRSIVDEMYGRFVDVVAEGRESLSRERVLELADGRVYSARQALDAGLVDEIGTAEDAEAELRRLAGLDTAQVVEQRRRPTLSDLLFGAGARVTTLEDGLAPLLRGSSGARFLYYWPGGR